jgi:hypothetical protein
MLLATIPSFHGYYMKGALEVGKASTVAFVWTSVSIILFNYILTQLLLDHDRKRHRKSFGGLKSSKAFQLFLKLENE